MMSIDWYLAYFTKFRISERYRRQRIGEGAIGLLLWRWIQLKWAEVYVTVFDKHTTLISQFERFGFQKCGVNLNGENVLVKNRNRIDFSDPYKAFPFIKDDFDYAGYIIIDDYYHDTTFAYSELANTTSLQSEISSSVSNGLSKIYVGKASKPNHKIGEPVLIYRRYTQGTGNNVNMDWLDRQGCWAGQDQYPTEVHLTANQFKKVLMEGNVNVSNVIIH